MKGDIAEFVAKCPNCQQVKVEHQKLGGLLQEIKTPTWKWEDINFVVGLLRTQRQYDSILVIVDRLTKSSHLIVDRLTKSSHFITIKSTYSAEDYARIFIDEIVCLHGIPLSIISDRGAQFTSRFWRLFQKGLGNKVKLSTGFIPKWIFKRSILFNPFRICLEIVSLI